MYDLIILGGGPGGYELSSHAAKKGLKVAIVEKDRFGGTCVTVGCIPSKAFLHAEKTFFEAKNGKNIGVNVTGLTFNQKQLVKYKDQKVDFLVKATEMKVKRSGAKIYKGFGTILPESKAQDFKISIDGKEEIAGRNLVIATGSTIFYPNIKGLESKKPYILDSNSALSLNTIPKNLLVMGGGVIGLELSTFFAGIGSNVTVVEINQKIAGQTDNEIAKKLQKELEDKKKIKFLLGYGITKIESGKATIVDKDKKESTLSFDKILVAAGRRPLINGFGLENLKVFVERGAIVTDDSLRTNIPGLYAIGDVNGKSMLAHTAYREGEIVLENILGNNSRIDYNKIPSVIYSTPEVAEIGLNEDSARAKGIDIEVKKVSMLYSGRFVIETDDMDGLMKVIIKKDDKEIIGLSILGSYASELIIAGSILVGRRYNVSQLKQLTFAHPTVGEILKNALFD